MRDKVFNIAENPKYDGYQQKKRKVHLTFIENIWGADLADMQFMTKFNKGISFFIACYWYCQKIRMGYSFER